jgi:hypothetical protein
MIPAANLHEKMYLNLMGSRQNNRFLQKAERKVATMALGGLKKMLVISIAMILTMPSYSRAAESKPILIGATVSFLFQKSNG